MTKPFILLAALLCATASLADNYSVASDSQLRAAIQNDEANITVTADIDLGNSTLSIAAGTTVTIDLNGHTLDRKLTQRGEGGGQVITIRSGATLNLSNGTLKGGWGGDSGGILNEGGTAILVNVTITGCTGDNRGGGICNKTGGIITMTGGAIIGNTSKDVKVHDSDEVGGGGIFNHEGATATLTNVTITDNKAIVWNGGGICNYGKLSLNDCIITGNTARSVGGGIWHGDNQSIGLELKMQGANIITDNMAGGLTSNLFMTARRKITCIESIAGSRIGITLDVVPNTFTSGFATYHSGDDYATIFTADRPVTDKIELITNVQSTPGEVIMRNNVPNGCVPYIEHKWDNVNRKVTYTTKMLTEEIDFNATPTSETQYKRLTSNDEEYVEIGTKNSTLHEYYVVSDEEVIFNAIWVMGPNVHIILCDNAWLHLKTYMEVGGNKAVYIHAQSSGANMGKLTNDYSWFAYCGIGGMAGTYYGGNIEIHGGDFDLQGGDAPGIGGEYEMGGNITIYDGRIKVIGGTYAAGIGGGSLSKDYGNITIYDGTIDVTGGTNPKTGFDGGAGIGGGRHCETGHLTIWGGNITARGGREAAGIGSSQDGGDNGAGYITINGGIIKAYGANYAAGIGGGDDKNGGSQDYGKLTISDGMMVSSWNGGEGPFPANERKDYCWYHTQARIEPCTHESATTSIIDASYHSVAGCAYCTISTQLHYFDILGECTACHLISLANDADNSSVLIRWDGATDKSVTLSGRTLKKNGNWNTLCLPFAVRDLTGTPLAEATLMELDTEEGSYAHITGFDDATGTLYLNFKKATSIEAGKPYLVKWDGGEEISNPVFENVTINNVLYDVTSKDNTLSFGGIYSPEHILEEDRNILYMGDDNKLYYPNEEMTINAFRGYFQLKGIEAGNPTDPTSLVRGLVLNLEETTGISVTSAPSSKGERSEYWYSLDGRRLSGKPTQKGIYINKGMKVVIE